MTKKTDCRLLLVLALLPAVVASAETAPVEATSQA